jgi:Fe-S cluster assembly scaffold protein SufB
VIAEKWGHGIEQKLVNDYNEFKLTGENPEAEAAYVAFLSERKELKNEVKMLLVN